MFTLLLGVGLLLLVEAFLPFTAGGELLIPTLLLVFGLGIKLAGTGSALISLPTVLTGILRWRAQGAYREREDLSGVVFPMALGSVLGALLGGVLLAFAPTGALKFGLGVILLLSAAKTLRDLRRTRAPA